MEKKLVECVPNISEGRDVSKIRLVTDVVEQVEGVKLLDVDPGKATNRTVITFVGEPAAVSEAAFHLIKKASEVIDMRHHSGKHPRFGATDVCPLVPVSNMTMEECVEVAHALGKRIGEELQIPGYYYEYACTEEKRRNLASCRSGEYEGLRKKLAEAEWTPDFGPAGWNEHTARTGCTAISARNFLVAYNINLNTTSTRRANAIAFDIREAGRIKREGNKPGGKPILDDRGNKIRIAGKLKCVKGLGWYIKEYGIAQISYNLTDISQTPVHIAFDETYKSAESRGLRITGSELIGLIPLQAMLDAADFFLRKQQRSLGIPEGEKIKIAVKSLGLDDLKPFNPKEKIIEYMIAEDSGDRLVDMSLSGFSDETLSESPAPGGGSIAAYCGALGAALGTMVANLSSHKRGWDDRWEYYSDWAVKGKKITDRLVQLVDEDTEAFNKIMDAYQLPKGNKDQRKVRDNAIEAATKHAIMIPFQVMETACRSFEVLEAMANEGLQASVSDAGVGACCARTAVLGAGLNVRINSKDLKDRHFADDILAKADDLEAKACEREAQILKIVSGKL